MKPGKVALITLAILRLLTASAWSNYWISGVASNCTAGTISTIGNSSFLCSGNQLPGVPPGVVIDTRTLSAALASVSPEAGTYAQTSFSAFYDTENNWSLTTPPTVTHNGYDVALGPYLTMFPKGWSASQATGQDFSGAGEIDLVGCDPQQDPDCLNIAAGGLAEMAFYNESPTFGGGQSAGKNSSNYSVSVFAAPGRFPNYQVWMTSDVQNGPFLSPIDASMDATILNTVDSTKLILLSPQGGKVGIGTADPRSALSVVGNIEIATAGAGLVLHAPNGSCFTLSASNLGAPVLTGGACP